MRIKKMKNKLLIEISGEPIEAITNFFKSFSQKIEEPKKITQIAKTIFEGYQYHDKDSLARAIISSYSKKFPELSRKFISLAESKNMNKDIALEINSISPLWYKTVMEHFNYGKSS